jgi:hypothetical protein
MVFRLDEQLPTSSKIDTASNLLYEKKVLHPAGEFVLGELGFLAIISVPFFDIAEIVWEAKHTLNSKSNQ